MVVSFTSFYVHPERCSYWLIFCPICCGTHALSEFSIWNSSCRIGWDLTKGLLLFLFYPFLPTTVPGPTTGSSLWRQHQLVRGIQWKQGLTSTKNVFVQSPTWRNDASINIIVCFLIVLLEATWIVSSCLFTWGYNRLIANHCRKLNRRVRFHKLGCKFPGNSPFRLRIWSCSFTVTRKGGSIEAGSQPHKTWEHHKNLNPPPQKG